jgi:hypothetical protein
LKKIYKDWVIEKSITHKTVDNYDNNLRLIKNTNTSMTNEAPPDKSKEKADENNIDPLSTKFLMTEGALIVCE